MPSIEFHREALTPTEQAAVAEGFAQHSEAHGAPQYRKAHVKWLVHGDSGEVSAVLAADLLWDWLYIDELWVTPALRGEGLGRALMQSAESFALTEGLQGLWLWTQSWQGDGFYSQLGFEEFTRFDAFPVGHTRIGFRKRLTTD
ncbi:MAG: GNAT family N-acetyltransferase [Pseudomonadota bacterium]